MNDNNLDKNKQELVAERVITAVKESKNTFLLVLEDGKITLLLHSIPIKKLRLILGFVGTTFLAIIGKLLEFF